MSLDIILEEIKKCNSNSTGVKRDIYGLVENVKNLIDEYLLKGNGELITGDQLFDSKDMPSLDYAQLAVNYSCKGANPEQVHNEIARRAYQQTCFGNDEKTNWYYAVKELSSEIFSRYKQARIDASLGIANLALTF